LPGVFATALGDVEADQAGSASGTLNAVQQIANSAGAALVSTVVPAVLRDGHPTAALTASLGAVCVVLAVCAALVPLLPTPAAADHH
jgi:predicted MFS family arabinose efflux permease